MLAISFQLRFSGKRRGEPLIFTSTRRIPRTIKRAVGGWFIKTNSRRNVVSRLANQCACASTAAGKTIHSARRSRGKKLIAGSCHAIHASIDIARPASATINITRCHGLKIDIVDPTFSMFLAGHRTLGLALNHLGSAGESLLARVAIHRTGNPSEIISSREGCARFDRTFLLSCVSDQTV